MDELPLGRKIYVLREDRKLSQSKLEVEAGLSFGTLSRIENGNINPTKETLVKIADVLDLHDDEFGYLIGRQNNCVEEKDAQKLLSLLENSIKLEKVPLYLMDNKFHVWFWNKQILELFQIPEEIAKEHVGLTTWDILFHKDFGVIKKVPKSKIVPLVREMLITYRSIIDKQRIESKVYEDIRRLKKHDLIKQIWDQEYQKQFIPFSTEFWINYYEKTLRIDIQVSVCNSDSRFMVVKYFPKDVITVKIFDEINKKIEAKIE